MTAEEATTDYLELPLERYLDLTASREPAPAGGSAAAVTVALAAALTGMVARLSTEHLAEAAAFAARADTLRRESSGLAQADAVAYRRVLGARGASGDPDLRRRRVGGALSKAADVPLAVAETGAKVAGLAASLAKGGNPNLRGDAICAVGLAEAGTRAADVLVEINLSEGGFEDGRIERAGELVRTATTARGEETTQRAPRPGEGYRQGGRR